VAGGFAYIRCGFAKKDVGKMPTMRRTCSRLTASKPRSIIAHGREKITREPRMHEENRAYNPGFLLVRWISIA
jgi:hypothetical protein